MQKLARSLVARLNRGLGMRAESSRVLADQARDRQAWAEAAEHYRAYLSAFSRDVDIWIQLGHMHKEAGQFEAAEQAYGRALRLRDGDHDLLLNFGHLRKLQGKVEEAAELYTASARLNRGGQALVELQGNWLPAEVRESFLAQLHQRDPASEKALRSVVRGAKIRAARGVRFESRSGMLEMEFDPQIELELAADVRNCAVALLELEFERASGFACTAGMLYLDLGRGYQSGYELAVPYPAGEDCKVRMFVAAPAAVSVLRWDPTELADTGITLKKIAASAIRSLDHLIELAFEDQSRWTFETNRITPGEMRSGLAPFFARTQLGHGDLVRMQSFLPTARDKGHDYAHWRHLYASPTADEFNRMSVMVEQMNWRPRFSFVMPVYNTPPHLLREAMDSMLAQNYPDFEICVADDASPDPQVAEILHEYAQKFPQVRFVRRTLNGHISAASNSALALATGDFVVLMDHDDLLPAYALFVVASYLNKFPDAKILFSDEDKISLTGEHFDPYFKSAYNEFLMFGHNMVSHLGIYDRVLIEQISGFRMGLEGSQDYDLFLRASEQIDPTQIVHIPHVLYHWRQVPGSTAISADQKDYAELAARNSINGHFERLNLPLQSIAGHAPGNSAVTPQRERDTRVSIVIPTRNGVDLLADCLASIARRCPANVEVIIADNDSDEPEALRFLDEVATLYPEMEIRVVRTPGVFNFSSINNLAAAQATGEILCFLNNDTEVIDPAWIHRARGLLAIADVGAVGGRLLYPDGTIQHFGLVTGMYGHGVAGGVHLFQNAKGHGYFSKPRMIQEFTAVTAACLFVRTDLFHAVGGFETDLAVAYNDVDLCLKIRQQGKRVLCDPRIELIHKESKSRGGDASPEKRERLYREADWMRRKWGSVLAFDPYFSPNHSLDRPDFALAYPPRQKWPWEYATPDVASPVASGRLVRAPRFLGNGKVPDKGFLAICAIMKNEATNIVEWLAYHHAIGVEKFYLYDNRSTDHVVELLQPLVEKGIVDIIPWPINPGQLEAYEDFAERHGPNWTWAAFIDMDEFINPYGYESMVDWLSSYEDASAVAIQWMNYGPNGHDHPPEGLLIDAYTTRFPNDNLIHGHVKTIVRMADYASARSPHSFWVNGRVVDEYNQEIDQQAGDYAILPVRHHTAVCINHYYTRSRAEWHAKVARGMADSALGAPNRRDPAWIEHYEKDAIVHDETITKFSAATRRVFEEWGYPVGPSIRQEPARYA